jgi:tRNA modification GTPase
MKGLLGDRAETWRARLIQALALVEAGIDFSDEADVPAELTRPALDVARALRDEISTALDQAGRGERLRDGLVVAIAGPPNAGKSTLLNRIAKREVAIVSPFAGTTRDVIEVHLDLGGYPVTLLDTAGVRESNDPVEQEGVRRAQQRAASADLILWVTEGGQPMAEFVGQWPMKPGCSPSGPVADEPVVWNIRNKSDLLGGATKLPSPENRNENVFISISAKEGAGLDKLLGRLEDYAQQFFGGESGLITRERHRFDLAAAKAALDRALAETADREELVAEELRLASRALGRLTGKVDVEDVLDVIFRDFCIGK